MFCILVCRRLQTADCSSRGTPTPGRHANQCQEYKYTTHVVEAHVRGDSTRERVQTRLYRRCSRSDTARARGSEVTTVVAAGIKVRAARSFGAVGRPKTRHDTGGGTGRCRLSLLYTELHATPHLDNGKEVDCKAAAAMAVSVTVWRRVQCGGKVKHVAATD